MAYIYPAPGVANVQATLSLTSSVAGTLAMPALQDITVNNSNDVFTWTQLDSGSKLQVATTATNSMSMNCVLDKTAFFGNASATSTGATGPTITGNAYVTGLAPTVSADSPVWVSPVTLTVTGDYTVA